MRRIYAATKRFYLDIVKLLAFSGIGWTVACGGGGPEETPDAMSETGACVEFDCPDGGSCFVQTYSPGVKAPEDVCGGHVLCMGTTPTGTFYNCLTH